jgi:exodeoxyribonuclease V beta subunit
VLQGWEALRDAPGLAGAAHIGVAELAPPAGVTALARHETLPALLAAPAYTASFERDWSVGSFTSLRRASEAAGADAGSGSGADAGSASAPVPRDALQEKLLEAGTPPPVDRRIDDAPWHRFPRGSVPGNFLHEQLEWMAQEGYQTVHDLGFDACLERRIERAGWGNRIEDAMAWLRAIAVTPLPPLGASLSDIAQAGIAAGLQAGLPEMEFWFPSERLSSGALDRLCRRHLLDGAPRPALPERTLHGMLKGFIDMVFEHEGRYWVLDYKSNALGGGDAAYHHDALAAGMAAHRYDIQGALYMLALHRLLQSRLGDSYDPATQLGGAVFFFLRGIGHPHTHGCYLLPPDPALLGGLDRLLDQPGAGTGAGTGVTTNLTRDDYAD